MNITSAHIAAIIAFTGWGLFPLYWKIFNEVPAWDLFGQRLLWSLITLSAYFVFKGKLWSVLKGVWQNKAVRWKLTLSAFLISSNWLLYIYAVNNGKVLEASMGYFLNPLINVFVGWFILKENIRPTQWPAILLALIAIIIMGFQTDLNNFPWIAITLSLTFAFYGLVRKTTPIGSMEGLTFETYVVIIPILLFWMTQGTTPLTVYEVLPTYKSLILTLSGLITCIPLVLFAFSAKQLKFQTLGFIQYLSPSFKFLCGLIILKEPLSPEKLQTFFLIWIALAWYTLESMYHLKRNYRSLPR